MTEIHAKPIVDGKFWIVEKDGTKIATLHKKENNKFILSSTNGEVMFNKKDDLTRQFGKEFFLTNKKIKVTGTETFECHGYPTSVSPYNSMYDVRNKLPLFTKSNASKSLYCAGYYCIKFEKGWVKPEERFAPFIYRPVIWAQCCKKISSKHQLENESEC